MSEPRSISEAVEWLRKSFRCDAARQLSITYEFRLAGDTGGVLRLRIEDGRLEAREGESGSADVVLSLGATDFFGVLSGRENPDLLFMAERLRVEGDLSQALRLRGLFSTPA